MLIIDTPVAMARARATTTNLWLKRRLALRDHQLHDVDCTVGELGPIIIVQTNDTLDDVERASGILIAVNMVDSATYPDPAFMPNWEACEADHGWYEITYVTSDDGSGAVIFVPDRDGIDPTLRAIVSTFAD